MCGKEEDGKRRKVSSDVLRLRREVDLESLEAPGGRGNRTKDLNLSNRYAMEDGKRGRVSSDVLRLCHEVDLESLVAQGGRGN